MSGEGVTLILDENDVGDQDKDKLEEEVKN